VASTSCSSARGSLSRLAPVGDRNTTHATVTFVCCSRRAGAIAGARRRATRQSQQVAGVGARRKRPIRAHTDRDGCCRRPARIERYGQTVLACRQPLEGAYAVSGDCSRRIVGSGLAVIRWHGQFAGDQIQWPRPSRSPRSSLRWPGIVTSRADVPADEFAESGTSTNSLSSFFAEPPRGAATALLSAGFMSSHFYRETTEPRSRTHACIRAGWGEKRRSLCILLVQTAPRCSVSKGGGVWHVDNSHRAGPCRQSGKPLRPMPACSAARPHSGFA
jgi:hypothetical protein